MPQLNDLVYVAGHGKSMFVVLGIKHTPTYKYPQYTLWNVQTLKDVSILCPTICEIHEIYGVPFKDIEFHFSEGCIDGWNYHCDLDSEISDESGVEWKEYDFAIQPNGNWDIDLGSFDPLPEDIEFIHDLQQLHRGLYGVELGVLEYEHKD